VVLSEAYLVMVRLVVAALASLGANMNSVNNIATTVSSTTSLPDPLLLTTRTKNSSSLQIQQKT
jgi:hypothetical protein